VRVSYGQFTLALAEEMVQHGADKKTANPSAIRTNESRA